MDNFICWRPWESEKSGTEDWKPVVENLHVDQSPAKRKGKHCVQGMIPLYPVTKQVGGLQVVPKSNTEESQEYLSNRYGYRANGDFLQINSGDKNFG